MSIDDFFGGTHWSLRLELLWQLKKTGSKRNPYLAASGQRGGYVKMLQKFMPSLHDEDNTTQGNQKLFLNDIIVTQLLGFFNIAIIGIMLICLHTGFHPSKYMFSLTGMIASGGATLEEIMPIFLSKQ